MTNESRIHCENGLIRCRMRPMEYTKHILIKSCMLFAWGGQFIFISCMTFRFNTFHVSFTPVRHLAQRHLAQETTLSARSFWKMGL